MNGKQVQAGEQMSTPKTRLIRCPYCGSLMKVSAYRTRPTKKPKEYRCPDCRGIWYVRDIGKEMMKV